MRGKDIAEESAKGLADRWHEPDPGGSGSRRDAMLGLLRRTCSGDTPDRPPGLDLRGIRLAGEDLSGLDLSGHNLTGADLSTSNLEGANLSRARLDDAVLHGADLGRCEFLGASMVRADLSGCRAERAGFATADLSDADLANGVFDHASFTRADLTCATLSAASLRGAAVREACLAGASFLRADLREADLKESNLRGASFHLADLRGARLLMARNYAKANWIGADIRDIDLRGAHLIRRHIMDENYLFEFRSQGRVQHALYWVWWATSDCGRSLTRWVALVFVVAALFALAYTLVDIDYGPHPTLFSPFYYSMVTMTTLGYGDVTPASAGGQMLAIAEALLGYVGLGGMLSILANRMARRAE
jgi:uncharacterized protein YjbI with pentapeptide repeats